MVEHVAVLMAAGFDDAQERLREADALGDLRAEAQRQPDHGVSQAG